jgi:uncharacterized protein (DUF58 family)
MWFKQALQGLDQQNVTQLLIELHSNGINLSIEELIPYQTKTSLIDLMATKNLRNKLSGNYLSRMKGRGMEFDEVRHYQTGDDIRAIDWRVTARTGKTHTKLFREEVERPVLITTDLTQSMKFGSQLLFKSVQAAHIAALVAWHVKSRGDRIGGIVFNQNNHCELKPRSRKEGVLHYLHALCQIHNDTLIEPQAAQEQNHLQALEPGGIQHNAFEDNCARLRQLARPGSLIYLITDAQQLSKDSLRHLSEISRHCELVVCLVTDPLEHQLPQSQTKLNVALTDGEQRLQLTLGDKNTINNYQQQALTLFKQREQELNQAGARVVEFCAGQSLENQLKNGVNSWSR